MSTARKRKDYGLSIRLPISKETHQALRIAAATHGMSKGLAIVQMAEVWLIEQGYLPPETITRKHSEAPVPAMTVPGVRDR